ncbi:MAG: hypothetical protein HKN79_05615, partial [Flavobacteriales bacterium]|nr:hypothetical protein [Flavobacteriales bacterium]
MENKTFIDKVVNSLRNAAVELEELQVQAALGKAEAKDKWEETKHGFTHYLHETKSKVQGEGGERWQEVQAAMDRLKVQLALGKAETSDAYHEQKKKISNAIHDLQLKIKKDEKLGKAYSLLNVEAEKFKLKMESLEGKFDESKVKAEESFEEKKKDFNRFVETVENKLSTDSEGRWSNFQDEMSEAFS